MKPHPVLFPISLLYGCGVALRNTFFDIGLLKSHTIGIPVISVGNITTGGTGKTPIVKNVAGMLINEGKKVAIVSRGYGRKSKGLKVVSDGHRITSSIFDSGDEPYLLAHNLLNAVVIVDEHRVRAATHAVKNYNVDCIVMDDGFQHRFLQRNLDIVLADVQNSPFDTMLLPAGYRRECVNSLRRAQAIVATKADNSENTSAMLSRRVLNNTLHKFTSTFFVKGVANIDLQVIQPTEYLQGCSVVAFCGIAKPNDFINTVMSCGAIVKDAIIFSDHHFFESKDIEAICSSLKQYNADYAVTTEKDAVRLAKYKQELSNLPIVVLQRDVIINEFHEWKTMLLSVF